MSNGDRKTSGLPDDTRSVERPTRLRCFQLSLIDLIALQAFVCLAIIYVRLLKAAWEEKVDWRWVVLYASAVTAIGTLESHWRRNTHSRRNLNNRR